jgi:hypothetical protein
MIEPKKTEFGVLSTESLAITSPQLCGCEPRNSATRAPRRARRSRTNFPKSMSSLEAIHSSGDGLAPPRFVISKLQKHASSTYICRKEPLQTPDRVQHILVEVISEDKHYHYV